MPTTSHSTAASTIARAGRAAVTRSVLVLLGVLVVLLAGPTATAGTVSAAPGFSPVACYDNVLRPASSCLLAAPNNGDPVSTRSGRRVEVHTFVAVRKPDPTCPARATVRVSTRRGDPRVATTARLRTVPVLLEGHARCRIDGHLVLRAKPQHDAKVRVAISHPLLKPAQYEVHRVRD